jgi:hypothetical protein
MGHGDAVGVEMEIAITSAVAANNHRSFTLVKIAGGVKVKNVHLYHGKSSCS